MYNLSSYHFYPCGSSPPVRPWNIVPRASLTSFLINVISTNHTNFLTSCQKHTGLVLSQNLCTITVDLPETGFKHLSAWLFPILQLEILFNNPLLREGLPKLFFFSNSLPYINLSTYFLFNKIWYIFNFPQNLLINFICYIPYYNLSTVKAKMFHYLLCVPSVFSCARCLHACWKRWMQFWTVI